MVQIVTLTMVSPLSIFLRSPWIATTDIWIIVYVLSLPSFTWINMYTGDSPRYAMTCHLVGNRQMITVGGAGSASITKECDWERKGVAIYDLSTLSWGSTFTHDAAAYEVPEKVTLKIGGVYVHLLYFLSWTATLTI